MSCIMKTVMARPVVLYDEDCGFCRWTLAKLLRLDRHRRLRPVPIGSAEGDALLEGLSEEERLRSWHLSVDGVRYSGGAAFAPLLALLPRGRRLSRIASRFPAVCHHGYVAVATRRSLWGRWIPDEAKGEADALIRERARP